MEKVLVIKYKHCGGFEFLNTADGKTRWTSNACEATRMHRLAARPHIEKRYKDGVAKFAPIKVDR